MTVGLLVITHNRIGEELLGTVVATLGICPLCTETLAVSTRDDPDWMRVRARRLTEELDQGGGVLVLTDIFGSTPSNIAYGLLDAPGVRVVSGVNLPMLLRVLNYPQLSLEELAEKALSGGRDGIIDCCPQVQPPARQAES